MHDIKEISETLIERIEEVLDYFNLEYTRHGDRISMPCPIHGGDNPNGLGILLRDVGNWQCFTHQCHMDYGSPNGASVIQLVSALLSDKNNRQVGISETLTWLSKLFNISDIDDEFYNDRKAKTEFIHLYKYISKSIKSDNNIFIPKAIVKNSLKIPSEYFINRGYSREILQKFDVGECIDLNKPMYGRAVVPFYDDSGQYMVGCSGRSIYDKCKICGCYHHSLNECPKNKKEKASLCKWKHSFGFDCDSYLYNYWNAIDCINKNNTAILVEGPGDIWRLEEAGYYNGLAILGAQLKHGQRIILEKCHIINLILAFDSDEAGIKCRQSVKKSCSKLFNIYEVDLLNKDIGDSSVDEVRQIFNKITEKLHVLEC